MMKKLTSQQMDSRSRGNDSALVHGETLPMRFTLNQNCHSEVLRGIPLKLTSRDNGYFSLRPLRLCGEIPSEVPHA
jgi:hypothetical protein